MTTRLIYRGNDSCRRIWIVVYGRTWDCYQARMLDNDNKLECKSLFRGKVITSKKKKKKYKKTSRQTRHSRA